MKRPDRETLVACPLCRQPSRYSPENRYRPFCSERCRMIDLGAWASDAYVVPGKVIESDDDAPAPPPAN